VQVQRHGPLAHLHGCLQHIITRTSLQQHSLGLCGVMFNGRGQQPGQKVTLQQQQW
jgi:hypothetical protein